ncbi:hypothetical protein ACIP5Y_10400 [Nocardia sp. NPDC088792]|uniref:hypothetical protein n=1 Tax=Nocardia sp. NPDC088792 TaxID=3364332 RepID=UPI0038114300
MSPTQVIASTAARRKVVGIIADGVVKVLLAAGFILGATRLGTLLGVPTWLMVSSGLALLIAGGTEIRYVHSRPASTYTRLMVTYDIGWALAALAGLLMARQGSSGGGEVWIGYQTVAPLAFATLLTAATPVPATPDAGTRESEH